MKNKKEMIKNYIESEGRNTNEKSSNLYNYNGDLINYYTKIAYFKDGDLYLNSSKYSRTTSKNQNLLKYYANYYNINIIEYEA